MFGIFWLIANGVARGIGAIKDGIENSQAWDRGYEKKLRGENKSNIYYDNRGCTRDLNTGRRVYIGPYGKYGEVIVEDEKGNILRNISQEKRDEVYENAKRNPDGKTVCEYLDVQQSYRQRKVCGPIYKDLNNGRLYVKRTLKTNIYSYKHLTPQGKNMDDEIDVYVDINTWMIVREEDREYKFRQKNLKNGETWEITDEEMQNLFDIVNSSRRENMEKVLKKNESGITSEQMWYRKEKDGSMWISWVHGYFV